MWPLVVTRPILFVPGWDSVNHNAPSGPAAIPEGPLAAVGTANSLTVAPSAAPAVTGPSRTIASATHTMHDNRAGHPAVLRLSVCFHVRVDAAVSMTLPYAGHETGFRAPTLRPDPDPVKGYPCGGPHVDARHELLSARSAVDAQRVS